MEGNSWAASKEGVQGEWEQQVHICYTAICACGIFERLHITDEKFLEIRKVWIHCISVKSWQCNTLKRVCPSDSFLIDNHRDMRKSWRTACRKSYGGEWKEIWRWFKIMSISVDQIKTGPFSVSWESLRHQQNYIKHLLVIKMSNKHTFGKQRDSGIQERAREILGRHVRYICHLSNLPAHVPEKTQVVLWALKIIKPDFLQTN